MTMPSLCPSHKRANVHGNEVYDLNAKAVSNSSPLRAARMLRGHNTRAVLRSRVQLAARVIG